MHYLREYRAGTHVDRPKRAAPPECPADHPHDAATCWAGHGCRCARCRAVRRSEGTRRRSRLRAYGRADQIGPRLVPAGPVRAHVEQLHAHGLGYERIAHAAGVGQGVMMDLIYGRRGVPSQRPAETIRAEYAERLLELTPDLVRPAFLDPTGTVRRLRALVAIGWPETHLAAALRMPHPTIWSLLHDQHRRVTPGTAATVSARFAEMWDKPQTGTTADRARALAVHYGWVGPLAWDDIDDPAELPEGVAGLRDRKRTSEETLDEIAFLLELGESPAQAATIAGRKPGYLIKLARAHNRHDIARTYERYESAAA